jgi:hypothetical protein
MVNYDPNNGIPVQGLNFKLVQKEELRWQFQQWANRRSHDNGRNRIGFDTEEA